MLEQCLSSIRNVCMAQAPQDIKFEIIIVQDGKSDAIAQRLKELCTRYHCMLLQANRSVGYTYAVNMGLRKAAGDLLVLLNDDICFEQKEWLDYIIKAFQLHPQVGIMGCRLIYPDRRIQHGGMTYIGGLQLLAHKYWGCQENEPGAQKVVRTVAVTGAMLAIKREVYNQIGPLNENFVIMCSDTDYCLTAHKKGWFVLYNGRAYAIHRESQTRILIPKQSKLNKIELNDKVLFYRKWSSELKQMHMQGII
ncbi:MAG TPA: glycosyltransferase [Clostridiales bacterium]|nr:glycosyltransferase [Clostridiales bacterium]